MYKPWSVENNLCDKMVVPKLVDVTSKLAAKVCTTWFIANHEEFAATFWKGSTVNDSWFSYDESIPMDVWCHNIIKNVISDKHQQILLIKSVYMVLV